MGLAGSTQFYGALRVAQGGSRWLTRLRAPLHYFPFFQFQNLVHAIRYFMLIMGNVYQGNIAQAANGINQVFKMVDLVLVHSLARLVKNK